MTAIVFPGQGSQFVGMSQDFYDNFKVARLTLEEIEDYIQMDLKKIIFENDDNLLNITKFTQISIFTASLLIFKTLEKESKINTSSINIMMGHSLGEYTALACSNKLTLNQCSLILKKRGDLMNDAVEPNTSGMAAIIGKESSYIQKIINDNNINLEIANDNSPMQVVVSGDIKEIKNSKDLFLNNNVKKYVVLNVSAAFHSKYMIEAQNILSEEIESLSFSTNNISLLSNFSAEISNDNNIIKKSLQKQMANKVRWTESIKRLEETGETEIIEIGPNKILSGLIKRISNKFDITSISNLEDMQT